MSPTRIVAVAVAVLVTAAIGLGSRAPYGPPGSDTSVLRLSFRLRGDKNEECRPRTAEELAALPAHMRSPEICEGHLVSYRLTLRIDDEPPVTRRFVPAGAKGDRPIFVMHDQPLTPGKHTIGIEFLPIAEGDEDDGEDEEDDDEHAPPLGFHSRINVTPGEIVLITMSEDATTLFLKR